MVKQPKKFNQKTNTHALRGKNGGKYNIYYNQAFITWHETVLMFKSNYVPVISDVIVIIKNKDQLYYKK